MRSCRQFYEDLNSILYHSCNFLLCLRSQESGCLFQKLGLRSINQMSNLFIHIAYELGTRQAVAELATVYRRLSECANLAELNLTVHGRNIPDSILFGFRPIFASLTGLKSCNLHFPVDSETANYTKAAATRRSELVCQLPTATTNQTFPFLHLPVELQLKVLTCAELIVPFQGIGQPQGLMIESGSVQYPRGYRNDLKCCGKCTGTYRWGVCCCNTKLDSFSTGCNCYYLPTGLLNVGKPLSNLAQDVLFSKNRIILGGDFDASRNWLLSRPKNLLSKIHSLELQITPRDIRDFEHSRKNSSVIDWYWLIQTISEQLEPRSLALSIDASSVYEWVLDPPILFDDFGMVEEIDRDWFAILLELIYRVILNPFIARRDRFRHLKSFFVYWPCYAPLETKAEKLVMGDGYDAVKRGKIPYRDRDWRLPHGWEWWKSDKGRVNEDWLSYDPCRMTDLSDWVADSRDNSNDSSD